MSFKDTASLAATIFVCSRGMADVAKQLIAFVHYVTCVLQSWNNFGVQMQMIDKSVQTIKMHSVQHWQQISAQCVCHQLLCEQSEHTDAG